MTDMDHDIRNHEALGTDFVIFVQTLPLDEARALAAILRDAVEGWRPIETAPKDGKPVLTWNGRRHHVAAFDKIEDGWVSSFKTTTKRLLVDPLPIIWWPLPAPPAEEGK